MKAIKCGEIFISNTIEFSFTCLKCSNIYDTFRDYQFHILEKHIQGIFGEGFNELLEVEYTEDNTLSNLSDFEAEVILTESKCDKNRNNLPIKATLTPFEHFDDINVKLEFENELPYDEYEKYDKTIINVDDEENRSFKEETKSEDEDDENKDENNCTDAENKNYEEIIDEESKSLNEEDASVKVENDEINENVWKCHYCDKVFNEINVYKNHKKRTKCGKCHLCNNRNYADIWSHISKFHKDYYHERKKLGLVVYERPVLTNLYCSYCDRVFKKETPFRVHMQVHEKSLDKCSYCGKYFKGKVSLATHIRTHTGERPFKCPHCPFAFSDNANLKTHIIIKHTAGLNAKCRFDNCSKTFKTKELRNRHEKYMHDKNCDYLCLTCGMSFKTSSKLNIHVKTKHMEYEDRPYKCSYCDKRYVFKREYICHLMSHTGEKPFKCRICSKDFRKQYSLTKHNKRQHSKSNEYEIQE